MNDDEQQRRLRRLRVLRWLMMVMGILMTYSSIYMFPNVFRLSGVRPIAFLTGIMLVLVSGCWMVWRLLQIPEIWAWAKSDEYHTQDRPDVGGGESAKGSKQSLMLILLLIGLVTAGVGMGMSDTTPVEKQICLEEDYSGDCVEWSEGSMQVTEQNQAKPIAIAGGFIVGLIGLAGIIIVE